MTEKAEVKRVHLPLVKKKHLIVKWQWEMEGHIPIYTSLDL